MDLIARELHDRPHARAYIVQYVALVLIILTFVIGAFAREQQQKIVKDNPVPSLAKESQLPPRQAYSKQALEFSGDTDGFPAAQSLPVTARMKSQFEFNDLFDPQSGELDLDRSQALASVLLNHDINAEVTVRDKTFAAALGRSLTLYQALLKMGVPADAVAVLADPAEGAPRADVLFVDAKFLNGQEAERGTL